MAFHEPMLFIWGLFAVITVSAVLSIRIDERQDHVALTITAAFAIGTLGPRAIVLILGAVVLAGLLTLARYRLPRHREEWPHEAILSVAWLGVTSLAVAVGFALANLVYSGLLGREYPVTLTSSSDVWVGAVVCSIAWIGAMSVRVLSQRLVAGSMIQRSLDPFDSMLIPFLLPTVCGFPIITASVATYRPTDPLPALAMLLWCFPMYAATWFDVRRRRLAQEFRRDALVKQRLAAIGEVSARIVHQSRHEVGLMGWSIYRLRTLVAGTSPDDTRAAQQELDALSHAKDRLGEMLTAELLHEKHESREKDLTAGVAEGDDATRPPRATLADLVADVVGQLRDEADREGVSLRIETVDGAGDRPVARQLRDVVFNLVDNAIDAASSAVVVQLEGTNGRSVLRVCDDGAGLSELDVAQAFEPFFTTKADGTGMGLAIADALVGDLGGDLQYERLGEITTFAVLLPPR